MAYLKTVITYNLPAEAEVDRAFLESHGLTVCLLNGNTARNELGTPFYIQLQVADAEYAQAVSLLREANPSRFGSQARVDELDHAFKRTVALFVLGAIPVAVIFFLLAPAPAFRAGLPVTVHQPSDLRPLFAVAGACFGGMLATFLGRKLRRKTGAFA